MKCAVSMVEFAVLQIKKIGGEGLDADKPVEGKCGRGVVGTVMEWWDVGMVPVLVALGKGLTTTGIQGTNWFG